MGEGRAPRGRGSELVGMTESRSSDTDARAVELGLRLLDQHRALAASDRSALADVLAALVYRAREPWPALSLSLEGFVAHALGTGMNRIPSDRPLCERIVQVHAPDLYLAYGCAVGNPAALAAFEARYVGELSALARRLELPAVDADDLLQALRVRLLVPTATTRPKIAEYEGRGSLGHWLRVAALRTFLDARRRCGPAAGKSGHAVSELEPEDLQDLRALADCRDFELGLLKEHYQKEFKAAFEAAVAELTSRRRDLLRYNIVHGLNIDQIAAACGIHRATAARRLGKARDSLLWLTRKKLRTRLTANPSEIDSILDLVRSRLDLSLPRVLGIADEPDDGSEVGK